MWAGKPQCSQDSSQARLVLHRSNCGEVRVSDEFPECGVIRKRTNLNLLHSDSSKTRRRLLISNAQWIETRPRCRKQPAAQISPSKSRCRLFCARVMPTAVCSNHRVSCLWSPGAAFEGASRMMDFENPINHFPCGFYSVLTGEERSVPVHRVTQKPFVWSFFSRLLF